VSLSGSDPDVPSNVVRYRLVSAPSGMQVNTVTGRITWTPTSDQGPATYTVIAEVFDDAETPLAGQRSFQVIVMDSNRAPIATAQDLTGTEEVSMSIRLAATEGHVGRFSSELDLHSHGQLLWIRLVHLQGQ